MKTCLRCQIYWYIFGYYWNRIKHHSRWIDWTSHQIDSVSISLIRWGLIVFTALSILFIPFMSHFVEEFWYLLILAPLMAVGTAILNPSKTTLLSLSSPEEEQGSVLGINQSFAALGRVIGPGLPVLFMNTTFHFRFGLVECSCCSLCFLFVQKCTIPVKKTFQRC